MKGCLYDPRTKISEHDYKIMQQFRCELKMAEKLKKDGHTKNCITFMIWDDKECSCKESLKNECKTKS